MPAGEPVAFTSIGRPNCSFGVMNAFSNDQNLRVEISKMCLVIALSAVTAMNGSSDSSRYLEMPPYPPLLVH